MSVDEEPKDDCFTRTPPFHQGALEMHTRDRHCDKSLPDEFFLAFLTRDPSTPQTSWVLSLPSLLFPAPPPAHPGTLGRHPPAPGPTTPLTTTLFKRPTSQHAVAEPASCAATEIQGRGPAVRGKRQDPLPQRAWRRGHPKCPRSETTISRGPTK